VGGSERVISYCAEEHGGRGVYLNKGGIEYSEFGKSHGQAVIFLVSQPKVSSLMTIQ
jgi:hypothetical protein